MNVVVVVNLFLIDLKRNSPAASTSIFRESEQAKRKTRGPQVKPKCLYIKFTGPFFVPVTVESFNRLIPNLCCLLVENYETNKTNEEEKKHTEGSVGP